MRNCFFALLFIAVAFCPLKEATSQEAPIARRFELNDKVDPCKNFYQHVCSTEIETFKLPSHRSRYTFVYADAYENFLSSTETFLKNLQTRESLSPEAKNLSSFFGSCLNREARAKEEAGLATKTVSEIQSLKTRPQLLEYARKKHQRGELPWFRLINAPHTADPKQWRLVLMAFWTTMPEKGHYEKPEALKDLGELATGFFGTVQMDNPSLRSARVLELEKRIIAAKPRLADQNKRWDVEEYFSKGEFPRRFPLISAHVGLDAAPSRWPVQQYTPQFYQFLENLLKTEDLETLKDFLAWRLLATKLDFGFPDWSQSYQRFSHKHLGGPLLCPWPCFGSGSVSLTTLASSQRSILLRRSLARRLSLKAWSSRTWA